MLWMACLELGAWGLMARSGFKSLEEISIILTSFTHTMLRKLNSPLITEGIIARRLLILSNRLSHDH
jgi:hypothetical protein